MGSRLGLCANIFRVLFCIVNLIIMLLGLAAFAVGIYLIVVNNTFAFVTGSTVISGAVLILIAGIVTVVIAAVGFLGACFKWRPLLIIYAAVLIIIVILEIAAGIVGYVFRAEVVELATGQFFNTSRRFYMMYRANENESDFNNVINAAVNGLQSGLRCCGIANGPADWGVVNPDVLSDLGNSLPMSCQCSDISADYCSRVTFSYMVNGTTMPMTINQTAYDMPCLNATSTAVTALAIAAGGVGIAFGILEIFGIIVAFSLCCCITLADKDKEVV